MQLKPIILATKQQNQLFTFIKTSILFVEKTVVQTTE